jgi:hypothetical protein
MIGWAVVGQAALLSLAVVMTSIFLVTRAVWLKHKKEDYDRILIELLFETEATRGTSPLQQLKIWPWQEAIYRDVLLQQIRVLSGDERAKLVSLYVRSGFLATDQRLLRSRAWSVRLRALIRMDLLTLDQCSPAFIEMMSEQNLLVALCATRALSRLTVEVDDAFVFSTLERVGGRRREAAIEVLSNLVTVSGPSRIIHYLEHKPDSPIALSCIRILGDLRAVEASGVLLQILNTPMLFPDEVITEVLESLRKIADPSALELAKETLHHSSAAVRAKSILFLQEFGEPISAEDQEALQQDPSIEVRRALQKNSSPGEAA